MVDRLIQRHGSAEAALSFMGTQAVGFEDTIAAHERSIAELRGKIPAEGSIVLPKAEATNWTKLQELKLTPEQIAEAVKERDTLKGTVSRTEAAKSARAAAKVGGLDEDAFEDHAIRTSLQIEMKDTQVTEHGKTVTKKLPFVRLPGDDKAPYKALAEYTGALPAHDQRALKTVAPAQPTGTPYIEQRPTPAGGTTGDKVADFIAKRNESASARPNPFAPPRQPAAATP